MESMEHDPAMTKQQSQLTGEGASGLGFYKELAVGSEASLLHFLKQKSPRKNTVSSGLTLSFQL
jgi:hypothetical protein